MLKLFIPFVCGADAAVGGGVVDAMIGLRLS